MPTIEPFWKRLRAISLYPSHSSAMVTIGVLAVCRLVIFLPLGFIFNILIWTTLYKYAFECLRATANGRLEPPEVSVGVDDAIGWHQIWLQAAFLVFNILGFLWFGPIVGTLIAIALALALPASIMSLAMDQSLAHALNPVTWVQIIGRLGWPYVAIAALYFVFNMSQTYAQALVVPFLPLPLALIVFYLIAHYAVVATFHLMGYLIYQYHEELGYTPDLPVRLTRPKDSDPDQLILDETQTLVRNGDPEAAAKILGLHVRTRGGSENVHSQYRKLLALTGQREESLRHGQEWISILLAQDKDKRAVDIARECHDVDANFRLADATQVNRLAQKAAELSHTQLALKLLSGFHKNHPKHRDIPKNYLLAAKLYAERMGKEPEARALIDQLAHAYPEHPLAPEIANYRQFLDRLRPATGAQN